MGVQVLVRLFAGRRGTGERTLEIPDDATVAAVWERGRYRISRIPLREGPRWAAPLTGENASG